MKVRLIEVLRVIQLRDLEHAAALAENVADELSVLRSKILRLDVQGFPVHNDIGVEPDYR